MQDTGKYGWHCYMADLIQEQGWYYEDYDYGEGWLKYYKLYRGALMIPANKSLYIPFILGRDWRVYITDELITYYDDYV